MSFKKAITIAGMLIVGVGLLSFCLTADTFAGGHDPNYIGKAFISPASPLYSLKVIKEGVEMDFAATPNTRLKRELEYSSRRIREVKSLIDEHREEYISSTLERYRYHLRNLEGMTIDDKTARQEIVEIVMHQPGLLIELYNQAQTEDGKRGIISALERVQKYLFSIDEAKVSIDKQITICKFLSQELSSDLLNEAEKLILEKLARECVERLPVEDTQEQAIN